MVQQQQPTANGVTYSTYLQAEWISLILILLGDCAAIAKQRGAL